MSPDRDDAPTFTGETTRTLIILLFLCFAAVTIAKAIEAFVALAD